MLGSIRVDLRGVHPGTVSRSQERQNALNRGPAGIATKSTEGGLYEPPRGRRNDQGSPPVEQHRKERGLPRPGHVGEASGPTNIAESRRACGHTVLPRCGWRMMATVSAADLAEMSGRIRDSAIVLENGEVLWPFDTATEAINELARLNRVVLGVDARKRSDGGLVTEVPISDYTPCGEAADVERARQEALAAVGRSERITGWQRPLILVTW